MLYLASELCATQTGFGAPVSKGVLGTDFICVHGYFVCNLTDVSGV